MRATVRVGPPIGALVAVCALVVCTACAAVSPNGSSLVAAAAPIITPAPDIRPDVMAERGRIVSSAVFEVSDKELIATAGQSVRAVYRSVVGTTGEAIDVTGAFFVPTGDPPVGGWPVIAFAHGTTGLAPECGPSGRSDLMGYSSAVVGLLAEGFAVAFTDYQGLGGGGSHPFLEPRSAGYNTIDAVRALHQLFAGVSDRWLALGGSQGGQAAWAANEFDATYGDGLDLVGVVAIAPAVNISGLAELAFTEALSDEQIGVVPLVIVGVRVVDPGLGVGAYLHGHTARDVMQIIGCGPGAASARASVTRADVKPEAEVDADALRDALRRMALPQESLGAPMLVINGLRDRTVLPGWVSSAVAGSCARGGTIEHVEIPDAGHADVSDASLMRQWIADRFAGKPAPTNCPGR